MAWGRILNRKGCMWILAGGMIGIVAFFILTLLGVFTRAANISDGSSTPVLIVVERPTSSPTSEPTSTTTPPATEGESPPSPPPSAPGAFSIGSLVQIFGTEGDGLRLRSQPGLDARIEFLGLENEVFEIADGPIQADGYRWWYLSNPYDASKVGWAVANYLRSVAGP
jgi:hypothetical protein